MIDQRVKKIAEQARNLSVKAVKDLGDESWKVGLGYHRRILAETQINRFIGPHANKVYKAQFSIPEVVGLLTDLDIVIH